MPTGVSSSLMETRKSGQVLGVLLRVARPYGARRGSMTISDIRVIHAMLGRLGLPRGANIVAGSNISRTPGAAVPTIARSSL
jgi:hypothetical protein